MYAEQHLPGQTLHAERQIAAQRARRWLSQLTVPPHPIARAGESKGTGIILLEEVDKAQP